MSNTKGNKLEVRTADVRIGGRVANATPQQEWLQVPKAGILEIR
jgi:hypothetical protein